MANLLRMNCLRQPARQVYAFPKITNHRHSVKARSQLESQFRKGFATHGTTGGVNTADKTRPVTKVEKIILDTIKVCLFLPLKYCVE